MLEKREHWRSAFRFMCIILVILFYYRSKVIVEGGCHAREWLSPAFVTYMLYTIVNAKVYKDPELERIAYQYTWIFIPVMNPDGYEYSHTTVSPYRS
jgi:murein tripeptide amidase MpaA